jgi:hypothetical protein
MLQLPPKRTRLFPVRIKRRLSPGLPLHGRDRVPSGGGRSHRHAGGPEKIEITFGVILQIKSPRVLPGWASLVVKVIFVAYPALDKDNSASLFRAGINGSWSPSWDSETTDKGTDGHLGFQG